MPQIDLKGSTFHIAGTFKIGMKAVVMRALTDGGAHVSTSINTSITALIAGRACQNATNKALMRGIPVLDETHLLTMLSEGHVNFEPEVAIPSTFDMPRAIAELRSLFDGPPNSDTWTQCLTLIEQCDEARRVELVHYISPFIAQWDALDLPDWTPDSGHALMSGAHPTKWLEALPRDELRVVPPLWISEMLCGVQHPKHALGRVINVHHVRTKSWHIVTMLTSPHLTHMHTLVLGMMNSYSKSLFTTLRTHDNMRSLKHLYVDINARRTRAHFLKAMAQPDHALDSLTHVYLRAEPHYIGSRGPDITELKAFPAFARAEVQYGWWTNTGWTTHQRQEHT